MTPRLIVPGRLVSASVGRVHVIRYMDSITLELAHAAQADYVEHSARLGGEATPLLMIAHRPLPLPVEVRSYWRKTTVESGFEAIALIMTGVAGLVSVAAVHLGGLLVEVSDVPFRSFRQGMDAARWLVETAPCGIDEHELAEGIEELSAVASGPREP